MYEGTFSDIPFQIISHAYAYVISVLRKQLSRLHSEISLSYFFLKIAIVISCKAFPFTRQFARNV